MARKMESMIRRCPCLRPEADEVHILDFKHSSLSDVPIEVFSFERTLEELYLDSNQIHDLPRPLFHCHGLRVLGLSDNEIHSVPHAIASLIHLEKLDVSKNGILDIPDNIKGCKCLRILEASVNPLGKLSDGFTQLINLEELYLNDTFIDFLPANFGRLSRLRILELRENHLKSLPKSMARLTEITRLDIGQNNFKELPDVVCDLPQLSELWCDCNRISSLPTCFGNLKNLTYLDASRNRISSIPNEIECCFNLTDLTLASNNLKNIPKSIGELKQLSVLRLDDNQLQKLPNSIGSLSSLEELILSQNDLKKLPHSLGMLRKMHTFIADDNLLEELPSELGSCSSLTILSVRGNRLTFVPDELGHVSQLRILNLSDNFLRYLPFSITKLHGLQALWLSENQNKPLIPLQTDIDIDTGQRVLTCYIFPQVPQGQSDGNPSDSDSFHLSVWEEQRPQRQHIKFAFDEKLDQPGKSTPYPKELKAHAKHARNQALKNMSANYVNIDDQMKEMEDAEKQNGEDDDDDLAVVQEAKLCPAPLAVLVKEARITKPNSPVPTPKMHDMHSLYKLDKVRDVETLSEVKEILAKDKARMLQHMLSNVNSSPMSSGVSPLSNDEDNIEKYNSSKELLNTETYKQSVVSHPFGADYLSVSLTGKENGANESEVSSSKHRGNTSTTIRKKIEGFRIGGATFNCLDSPENNHESDRELYSNVGHRTLPSKMTKCCRSDGYSSECEVIHNVSTSENFRMNPIIKTVKPATISAAIAKKLSNNYNVHRSQQTRKSVADVGSRLFNGFQNTQGHRGFFGSGSLPSGDHRLPDGLQRNNGISESQSTIYDESTVPRTPTKCSPATSRSSFCKPVSCSSPIPLPNLPPRSRANQYPSPSLLATLPPVLPPRQRQNIQPIRPDYLALKSPSRSLMGPSVVSQSSEQHRKPPPYHIAATYSKQNPDNYEQYALYGNMAYQSQAKPPSTFISNNSRMQSPHGSPSRSHPLTELQNDFCTSSPWSNRRLPHESSACTSTSLEFSQMERTHHGSDPSIRGSPSPVTSSAVFNQCHSQQRSHSSVNGAVVYDNPYAVCDTMRSVREPSPAPSRRSSAGSSSRLSRCESSPLRTVDSPLRDCVHISPRPSTRGLRQKSSSPVDSTKHRLVLHPSNSPPKLLSVSAPSTPPIRDTTSLPPYRAPPLYQSASTGSLETARHGLQRNLCTSSPLGLRRLGRSKSPPGFASDRGGRTPPSSPGTVVGQHTSQFGRVHLPQDRVDGSSLLQIANCEETSRSLFSKSNSQSERNSTRSSQSSSANSRNNSPKWDTSVQPSFVYDENVLSSRGMSNNGIFTARPVMIDSSSCSDVNDCYNATKKTFASGLVSAPSITQLPVPKWNEPMYHNVHAAHPAHFTQDKPMGGGMPIVVPTPQRAVGLSDANNSNISEEIYESAKNVSGEHYAMQQHLRRPNPWLFGQHRNPKVIPVVIQKNPDLGFSVTQYIDSPLNSPSKRCICISSVTPEGSASSVLKPGDKLLQVDGTDVSLLDLSRVQKILDHTGPTVFLMISRT